MSQKNNNSSLILANPKISTPAKFDARYRKVASFVSPINLIALDFFEEGQETVGRIKYINQNG